MIDRGFKIFRDTKTVAISKSLIAKVLQGQTGAKQQEKLV
jgi:hypothetical protein